MANPVCGDHWHGLAGDPVNGSTGCPWCRIEALEHEVSQLEDHPPLPESARLAVEAVRLYAGHIETKKLRYMTEAEGAEIVEAWRQAIYRAELARREGR